MTAAEGRGSAGGRAHTGAAAADSAARSLDSVAGTTLRSKAFAGHFGVAAGKEAFEADGFYQALPNRPEVVQGTAAHSLLFARY